MAQPYARALVTRRDRRAHVSRMRILDAALRSLVDAGYAGATTLMVQRQAGVSRGGLLHHYPSKDALLLAAAQRLEVAQVATASRTAARFRTAEGTPERIDEAVSAMWARYQELCFRVAAELWVAALHNEALRRGLGPAERELNAAIRRAIAEMFGPVHAAHPDFPAVRDVLLTSMRGVAVADAFDGRERRHQRYLDNWIRIARAMLAERQPHHEPRRPHLSPKQSALTPAN
jgi:AcrR family transcriptional regulator